MGRNVCGLGNVVDLDPGPVGLEEVNSEPRFENEEEVDEEA